LSTSPFHWNISDSSPTSPTYTSNTRGEKGVNQILDGVKTQSIIRKILAYNNLCILSPSQLQDIKKHIYTPFISQWFKLHKWKDKGTFRNSSSTIPNLSNLAEEIPLTPPPSPTLFCHKIGV